MRVVRVIDGTVVLEDHGHSECVTSVAFSPNGTMIASGSGDKTMRVVRVIDGKIVLEDHGHSDWVTSVAFSPDGR